MLTEKQKDGCDHVYEVYQYFLGILPKGSGLFAQEGRDSAALKMMDIFFQNFHPDGCQIGAGEQA